MASEIKLQKVALSSLHTDLTTDVRTIKVETARLVGWIECCKGNNTPDFINELIKMHGIFKSRESLHSTKHATHQANYTLLSSQPPLQKLPIITKTEELLKNYNLLLKTFKFHQTKFDLEIVKFQNPASTLALSGESKTASKNPEQKPTPTTEDVSGPPQHVLASNSHTQINADSLSVVSTESQ